MTPVSIGLLSFFHEAPVRRLIFICDCLFPGLLARGAGSIHCLSDYAKSSDARLGYTEFTYRF